MATPRTRLRLVLFQIRENPVPMRQEQSCFIERCRVARSQVDFINLVDQPEIRWRQVESAHAVIIGGAGAAAAGHPRDRAERLTSKRPGDPRL